jgi:HPt (histidine-containing phosphotransfer) domain-containing protein
MMRSLDNDAELAQQLAQLFVDNSQRLLARMRHALAAGDTAELGRAAHEMRGAVGNFHAVSAVAAAAGLESSAQAGDLARATRDFARVEAEIGRVFPLLESLSNGEAATPG